MKVEDLEKFDEKNRCKHGNPKVILPTGLDVDEDNGVMDKNTGGVIEVNGKPVWMNPCRTLTSARQGFVPFGIEGTVSRIGEKEGKDYYDKWWCAGKYSGKK